MGIFHNQVNSEYLPKFRIIINFRNGNKQQAMDYQNFGFLLLKIVLDVLSRILIFSAWMYTDNEGQFSTKRTVGYFYAIFLLYLLINCIINKYDDSKPNMNWIGRKDTKFMI